MPDIVINSFLHLFCHRAVFCHFCQDTGWSSSTDMSSGDLDQSTVTSEETLEISSFPAFSDEVFAESSVEVELVLKVASV